METRNPLEFKAMIINVLNKLGRRMDEESEKFNKE